MILKHLAKVYIIISFILIIGYLLVVFFLRKFFFFDYRILATLIVNATFGVPIVIHRKLENRERKVVTKILKLSILSLFVFAMVLIYWIPRVPSPVSGWDIYLAWFGSIVLLFLIGIIETDMRNSKGENRDTMNSVSLILYIGLMIWSIFILVMAMNPAQ